jgi:Holliday junction resolvase RusA-like endonuclease
VKFELVIPGKPTGKGRPRFAKGRTYTDPQTDAAELRVQRAWEDSGSPRLHDGPLYFRLLIGVERPQGHFKRDGSLSAAGLRAPFPTGRPDLDNVCKLVTDALNGLAYRDDAQIVTLLADRCWSDRALVVATFTELSSDDAIGWSAGHDNFQEAA